MNCHYRVDNQMIQSQHSLSSMQERKYRNCFALPTIDDDEPDVEPDGEELLALDLPTKMCLN